MSVDWSTRFSILGRMATTVRAAFDEFASRIEPTANQKADAKTKHTGVRDCLNKTLWVSRAFLMGSYARSTMIRPPSDIDLFVVLDAEKHANDYFHALNGSQKVLDRFHALLKDCYPTTPIRKDHPAVNLNFSTYGFDVVPAFDRQNGGYLILSRFGAGWMSTDAEKHGSITTAMNSATGGFFVPLTKMFKAWNAAHYSKLTGFHLEMTLAEAWPKTQSSSWPPQQIPVVYGSYAKAATALFPALSSRLAYSMNDPAGMSGQIDGYLTADDRTRTRQRLDSAASDAQVALNHEGRGNHQAAIAKWRDIFGDSFPAYA